MKDCKRYEVIIKGNDTFVVTQEFYAEDSAHACCVANDYLRAFQKQSIEKLSIDSLLEL